MLSLYREIICSHLIMWLSCIDFPSLRQVYFLMQMQTVLSLSAASFFLSLTWLLSFIPSHFIVYALYSFSHPSVMEIAVLSYCVAAG